MSTGRKHTKSPGTGRILGGYLAACLTSAVAVGVVFGFLIEVRSTRSEWRIGTTFSDTIGLTVYIAPVILSLTFLPAILFILWSEKRAEQRLVVHAGAGIAMAIIGSLILPLAAKGVTFQGIAGLAVSFLPAGLVAGVTYWVIAGRRAGAAHLPSNS
jgi:hypothetical protein